jgi:hypothetical protein
MHGWLKCNIIVAVILSVLTASYYNTDTTELLAKFPEAGAF